MRRDGLWRERSLGGGSGRFCRSLCGRSRSRRSRICSAEELGVDGRPGRLGVSIDGVLGKRSVREPGSFECGVAKVLTPWQGMMRSKSHPATVLASLAVALKITEVRNQYTNEKKCETRTPYPYSRPR